MSKQVEILYVEDNPNDIELTLHAFKKFHLANDIVIARDGEEALDLLFGKDRLETGGIKQYSQGHLAGPEATQGGRSGSAAKGKIR